MRTRRSWRNQERLWKELGGKQDKPRKLTPEEEIAFLERILADPIHSKQAKASSRRRLEGLKRRLARK